MLIFSLVEVVVNAGYRMPDLKILGNEALSGAGEVEAGKK